MKFKIGDEVISVHDQFEGAVGVIESLEGDDDLGVNVLFIVSRCRVLKYVGNIKLVSDFSPVELLLIRRD
jgi:hypothetical protein